MIIPSMLTMLFNTAAQFQPQAIPPPYTDLGDIVPIIIIPTVCGLTAWLAWVLNRTNHLRVKSQIEMRRQLLEKIHSSQDIANLLETDEGRRFLESISADHPISLREILSSVQKGVIFTMIGLGGILMRLTYPTGFRVPILACILVGTIGVGFLISSAITYGLSRSWGLISSRETPGINEHRAGGSLFQ